MKLDVALGMHEIQGFRSDLILSIVKLLYSRTSECRQTLFYGLCYGVVFSLFSHCLIDSVTNDSSFLSIGVHNIRSQLYYATDFLTFTLVHSTANGRS